MGIEDVFPAWMLVVARWWSVNATALSALIIGISAIVAYSEFLAQGRLARRRATYDLFLKTEIDRDALDLWEHYLKAIDAYKLSSTAESFIDKNRKEFDHICAYLGIYELVACGIKTKLLDETLCFAFWQRIMRQDCKVLQELLDYMRARPDWKERFPEYPSLMKKWDAKASRS